MIHVGSVFGLENEIMYIKELVPGIVGPQKSHFSPPLFQGIFLPFESHDKICVTESRY